MKTHAAPLRIGAKSFAVARVLQFVTGIIEQLVRRSRVVGAVLRIWIKAPGAGLDAHPGIGRYDRLTQQQCVDDLLAIDTHQDGLSKGDILEERVVQIDVDVLRRAIQDGHRRDLAQSGQRRQQ